MSSFSVISLFTFHCKSTLITTSSGSLPASWFWRLGTFSLVSSLRVSSCNCSCYGTSTSTINSSAGGQMDTSYYLQFFPWDSNTVCTHNCVPCKPLSCITFTHDIVRKVSVVTHWFLFCNNAYTFFFVFIYWSHNYKIYNKSSLFEPFFPWNIEMVTFGGK